MHLLYEQSVERVGYKCIFIDTELSHILDFGSILNLKYIAGQYFLMALLLQGFVNGQEYSPGSSKCRVNNNFTG
jgi:hypothetical protein